MQKLILIGGLLFTTSGFATVLHNYNEISSALTNGKTIHFVTDFSQCNAQNKPAELTTMSVGIFTPNEIGLTNDHIATALTHFTVNDPYFPGKPVVEFSRYTITQDDNMNVALKVFDAATYALLKDNISFDCKIDQATKVYT